MGTHPIFESDFDCLTESDKFGKNIMEIEPLVNDQKRKILAGQPNGDNVVKRAKLDLNSGDLVKPVALIETGDQENEIATSPATEPEVELVKVETDEPEITLDEIRRLKEIL